MTCLTSHTGYAFVAGAAAAIAFAAVLTAAAWFRDRYELGHRPLRLRRRWYGTGCHVIIKDFGHHPISDDLTGQPARADRYQVLAWENQHSRIPWVKITNIDGIDSGALWTEVTTLCPYSVPVLRPGLRPLRLHRQRFVPSWIAETEDHR